MHGALEPFHASQQKLLTAVLHRDTDEGETIFLVFDRAALCLKSDPEFDRVTVGYGPLDDVDDCDELTADTPWSRFIGKPFFWGWLTVNQQGFVDGVLVSFDGVLPEVGVSVVASSLETVLITRVNT